MGRVARLNARTLPEDTDPDFEFRYVDIGSVGRGILVEKPQTLTFENSPSRARRVLRPGDTIVSTVRTYLRAVLPIRDDASDLIASTGFAVLSPGADLDDRFLSWYAQSDPFIEEVVARSVGVSYPAIAPSDLARFPVPMPTLTEQRAIADSLDAETARIDALIHKKRRLYTLLQEQFASHVEQVVWREVCGTIPLMHLTPPDRKIMYGIVLPGPDVEDGVPIVKGGNVASGKLRPHELARTTREIEANYARARLAGGDVLYAIRGGIGDVAIAPSSITGANITQDVARVAPRTDVDARWIRYALESATARADALGRVVGATVKGINIRDLKRVRLPAVTPAEMKSRADELDKIEQSVVRIRQRLNRQIELLSEHRQALVTAAVTGEIGVAGAKVG